MTTTNSRSRILVATLSAIVAAAVILVVAILPAEYGLDWTGAGKVLGLTALADAGASATPRPPTPAAPTTTALQTDTYDVDLRPFEGVEYKYRLVAGGGLVYVWQSSAPVEFEFHGEPDGAPAKYFDSYSKGAGTSAQGTFTAARAGIHGWYWKNNTASHVKVTLRSSGFYSTSTEFRDGERKQRRFEAR